jgi:hypothetical protein
MLKDIVEARALGGYRLYLRFEDGIAGTIDLAPMLSFRGVFGPLREPRLLRASPRRSGIRNSSLAERS